MRGRTAFGDGAEFAPGPGVGTAGSGDETPRLGLAGGRIAAVVVAADELGVLGRLDGQLPVPRLALEPTLRAAGRAAVVASVVVVAALFCRCARKRLGNWTHCHGFPSLGLDWRQGTETCLGS